MNCLRNGKKAGKVSMHFVKLKAICMFLKETILFIILIYGKKNKIIIFVNNGNRMIRFLSMFVQVQQFWLRFTTKKGVFKEI